MPTLDEARPQLALANRILAHEGVLDTFKPWIGRGGWRVSSEIRGS